MMLPRQTLRSTAYDLADALDVNELYQQKGWTDGLPIVPPTEERVLEGLQAAGLAATDIVGVEPIRQRPITVEKVAINAVMAGCLPAYMPVVVAILRAMCQEPFNLHGSTASTGGSAPFIVVNFKLLDLVEKILNQRRFNFSHSGSPFAGYGAAVVN